MDAENKIQTCSTCGDAFIAGMINGKQLKNCRTCRDKKNKRKTPSETQETEKSQPPCSYSSTEEQGEYDEQPHFTPPTYEQSNNHYSNMPLCRPDYLMSTQEKTSQSIKQLLTNIHDSLTHKSPNTCANDMLNDIANRLTIIENDNYVREFIEHQKKQNEETTRLLNLIHNAIG